MSPNRPKEAYLGRDLMCVFDSEATVRDLAPDQEKLLKLPGLLFHATAAGKDFDCVSRSFAPKMDLVEDPVCGSGHCHILPYWSEKTGKERLTAYQASFRGGVIYGAVSGGLVRMSGTAALYSQVELFVETNKEA